MSVHVVSVRALRASNFRSGSFLFIATTTVPRKRSSSLLLLLCKRLKCALHTRRPRYGCIVVAVCARDLRKVGW